MSDSVHIPEQEPIADIENLSERIRELIGNPISVWAVAATIESLGIREVDAEKDFGYASIFALAEQVYQRLKEKASDEKEAEPDADAETKKEEKTATAGEYLWKPPLSERLFMFLKHYSVGLLFSLPMVSQVLSVLIFGYSLWAWLEFNEAQATVVAFGTISAFVVTGGFIQTLGRSVSRYMGEHNFHLAFEATKKIMNSGVLAVGAMAVFFYLVNIVIPFYPQGMLLLGLSYFVLISLLLLAAGVLYALEQRFMILTIIVLGTALVILGMDVFRLGIYLSQWIGMSVTILLIALYGYLYLRLKVKSTRQNLLKQSLPSEEVRYYISYRYFVYGFSYFLFLFLDRILAWTTGAPPPPYIFWFNTPYELGMDWALISLILTIAVLEYSIQAFSKQLLPLQKKASFLNLEQFNSYFKRFYRGQLFLLLVVGVISVAVTYYSINSLKIFQQEIPEIKDFFASPITTEVFWIGSISYLFMVMGLLNTLFFFTLNKSEYALYSILGAVAVNFSVGYICSRIISFEYAVLGLLAGSVAFAVISGIIAKSFFKRLDYYYYSSF